MKKVYFIFISLVFICSCNIVQVKDNWYKEGDVESYYRNQLIDTTPVKEFFYLAKSYQQIRDIEDAEVNGRILFSPHESYKNVYVLRWFNKNNQIIKELTIELYKPVPEPDAK